MSLFNRIARFYDRIVGEFDLEEINSHFTLQSEILLLDLGGGTGRIAKQLLSYVNDCVIIDSSFEMLREARNISNKLYLLKGLAENIPIKNNSIEQIFLNDSLHHIQNQVETIAECFRILNYGGELIIREFDRSYFWNIFLRIMEFFLCFRSKFVTPEELTKLCEKFGFMISSITRPNKSTFILIAKKEEQMDR